MPMSDPWQGEILGDHRNMNIAGDIGGKRIGLLSPVDAAGDGTIFNARGQIIIGSEERQ